MIIPAVDPEPVERRLAPRAGPDPRLRARDHPRHRRRDLDRRAALGRPAAAGPARSRTSRSGRCRSAWSAAGSTTWPPTTSATSAPTATRGRSSTSGAAASGSGARSPRRGRRRSSPRAGAACGSRRWSTPWRPASSSPRRSAAGATGSTRSCSASPPTCRGRSRSTPQHRPPGYEDQATFHPTFLYECVWDLLVFGVLIALDRRFKFGHGRMLALYVMGYTLGRGWIEMLRIDTVELERRARAPVQRLDLDRAVRRGGGLLRRQPAAPARAGGVGVRRGARAAAGAHLRGGR